MAHDPWNSLEVAKLVVAGLTPLFLVIIGLAVQRALKRFEHQQWRSQKLIEKRIQIYDRLAPQLNLLLCYFTYVGPWRDINPHEIIKSKREIDREIYLAKPLFAPQFFNSCMEFLELCFETYTGWGQDARLKTAFHHRRDALGANWNPEWEQRFSTKQTSPFAIRRSYECLMKTFSEELGVCATEIEARPDRPIGWQAHPMWVLLMECAA